MKQIEFEKYDLVRGDETIELHVLYQIDRDQYEGKTWVDLIRMTPSITLSPEEIREMCETLAGA